MMVLKAERGTDGSAILNYWTCGAGKSSYHTEYIRHARNGNHDEARGVYVDPRYGY